MNKFQNLHEYGNISPIMLIVLLDISLIIVQNVPDCKMQMSALQFGSPQSCHHFSFPPRWWIFSILKLVGDYLPKIFQVFQITYRRTLLRSSLAHTTLLNQFEMLSKFTQGTSSYQMIFNYFLGWQDHSLLSTSYFGISSS